MSKSEPSYDIAAISQMLLDAFTAKDLRRFCRSRPTFPPILGHGSMNPGDIYIDNIELR